MQLEIETKFILCVLALHWALASYCEPTCILNDNAMQGHIIEAQR